MNSEGPNKQTHGKISVTSRSEHKMCKLFNSDPIHNTNERKDERAGRCLLLPKIRADMSNGSGICRLCSGHVCFYVIKCAILNAYCVSFGDNPLITYLWFSC